MELFRSELFYIFVRQETSLWWNRSTGGFSVRSAWDLSDIEDIECLGVTDGIIGKVEHSNVFEPRLMIIKESVPVGQLYFNHTIYKIKSICFLNMGTSIQELDLTPCTKHGSSNLDTRNNSRKVGAKLFENSAFLNKTVGAVKNVSNTIKNTTQQAATQVKQTVKKQRDPKVQERFEKRLTDELHKIFDDTDSFYYSRTLDLTNSLQRQYEAEELLEAEYKTGKTITDITKWWKHVDDRFFWNKHMLKDIVALGSPDCEQWVLPIIQGYVSLAQIAIEPAEVNPLNTESLSSANNSDETFTLGVISRRSRYQAGTRYNRRGIGPDGKVANYVETEQIVSITAGDSIHRVSFLQVRGSVPIFWSQPDYKFRPPPRLDRSEEENQEAFKKHFEEELSLYKKVCIVNLVEQQGRERIIFEAYGNHVRNYNSKDIIYTTFDFHEYCRGMHYENVSILMNAIAEEIEDMRFCWRDQRGLICSQTGVPRVNCVDCLDRTNVVQTAIAKHVLESQLCRLGLFAGDTGSLPRSLLMSLTRLWADNGDVLSRQYAGTKALKGDYTRTGERKFTGLMKDGVASANRYYLSTFKDAIRQVAIDVMTGESRSIPEQLIVPENIPAAAKEDSVIATSAMAQHVKSLIDDCKKLVVDTEPVLGAWGLIDADPVTGDPHESEMDAVLVLTSGAYHVAEYDETSDRWGAVRTVALSCVTKLEIGTFDTATTNIFSVTRKSAEPIHCIRISYTVNNEAGYFHMFRSTSLRFFNNMAVLINTKDEMIESLHSILESIAVARDVARLPPIPFLENVKMDKRKSKVPASEQGGGRTSLYLDIVRLPTLTRNVSEKQLVDGIKSVGSKALTNMSEQLSKLNRLGSRAKPSLQLKFDQGTSRTKKMFTLGGGPSKSAASKKKGSLSDGLSSDYSSDDENRTNIFEPTLDNFENVQVYIGKARTTETDNDCELIENPLYSSKIEPHEEFETTDIKVEYSPPKTTKTPVNSNKKNPFDIDKPVIQVESEAKTSNALVISQKLSHSSNELNHEESEASYTRSNSQFELSLNIAQSHSESALKQLKNIASPVSSATKDMVFSPLSKLAKGVQNLGANLDPRKIKGSSTVKHISEAQYEDHKKLHEQWRECNTKLIAL